MKLPRLSTLLAMCTTLVALGLPAVAAPKKVLVVTVTTGFRHSCIPLSEEIFRKLAAESGQFTVDFVSQPALKTPMRPKPKGGNTPAQKAELKAWQDEEKAALQPLIVEELKKLSPANLKKYDCVVFASTTGDLPIPDKQGLVDWVAAGHGFVGVHAATDTFHGYTPFVDMIGGEFLKHGPQVEVDCLNCDHQHAAVKHLPASWTVFDEIYQFKNYEQKKVRDLLRLDKHPNDKTPGHYPVSWCKSFGKGKIFYTSLGHREDMWDPGYTDKQGRKNIPDIAKQYQAHVLGGLLWALGLAPGSSAPQAK